MPYVSSVAINWGGRYDRFVFPAWQATLLSPMLAIRDQSDSLWTVTRRGVEQAFGLSLAGDSNASSQSLVMTDLIEASRRAGSFTEVRHIALATVRQKVQAHSVLLLEQSQSTDFYSPGCGLTARRCLSQQNLL